MSRVDIAKWADILYDAERRRVPIHRITETEPELTLDEAYEIQDELLARRIADGERLVGAKLGLTSRAKQRDMGIDQPIYGWLTDAMLLAPDRALSMSDVIHPRTEPEIALVLGSDLAGPGVTPMDALDATSAACAAMEVIDSRYVDFRFELPDVIADNTSASRFVLGGRRVPAQQHDLSLLGCVLEERGTVVATAAGAAVLGHPAAALAELANHLGRRGKELKAGWVVLTGGLTAAVPVRAGSTVTASFAHLGMTQVTGRDNGEGAVT